MVKRSTAKSQDKKRGTLLGKAIKDVRETLGLSQDDFGAIFGVKGRTISRWETGDIPDWLRKAFILRKQMRQAGKSFDDLPFDFEIEETEGGEVS